MQKTDELVNTLVKAVDDIQNKKAKGYDTQATVTRIEGGTAYVHIPGGVDETPAQMTITAKKGDTVRVRVANGTAWLVGNATAPPTDDATANAAVVVANTATTMAGDAIESANIAAEAAESAKTSAGEAQASANEAKTSATNANEYATRALNGLSAVESVNETLTWITQHGTMTLTSDTELDPTHVYFVLDPDGDYVVGSTHYSLVIDPDVDDISTYYELTIDESLNNYVGTHLALTSEGLWLLPAASGVNKVLIATGAGTYTAGTYIIDSAGATVAKFTADSAQIGALDEAHLTMGTDGIFAYNDKGASVLDIALSGVQLEYIEYQPLDYEYVITTDNGTDTKTITELSDLSTGDSFILAFNCRSGNFNTEIRHEFVYGTNKSYTDHFGSLGDMIFRYAASNTVSVTLPKPGYAQLYKLGTYVTDYVPAWTFGERKTDTTKGGYSIALGEDIEASGNYTFASGRGTKAGSAYQTAIGKYNNNNSNHVFEVGYGTSSTPKNIFTVDTSGNVNIPSGSKYKINNTNLAASDVGALPTRPTSVEFQPSSSSAGNGGFIDFHYNQSSADYTSRIIEAASGALTVSGSLTVGGHSSAIGTVKQAYATAKTVNNDTNTNLTSISLEAGTWVITAGVRFPSNATGLRRLNVTTSSGSANADVQLMAVNGGSTQLAYTLVVTPSATTTYYLNCYQNSGSNLSLSAGGGENGLNFIRAVRIA